MAAINWQQQAFSPIKFDPTKGLAIASDAFGNIGKQIAAEKEAAATTDYRNQVLQQAADKQLFTEAAPQRAEDLRKATLARSAEQGVFADTAAGESGGSHMKSLLSDLQSNPEYMALSGPERADFAHQALNKNKRLMSDPTLYGNEVRTKLLESGKFSREEANTIAAEKTTQLFPTMDKDIALKLFDKGTGGSGASGGRVGRQLFDQAGFKGKQEQLSNFYALNEIDDKTASMFRMDPGDYNPTQQNVAKFVAQMGSGEDGVTQDNALQYLQTKMGNTGNVTSGHDIANLSPDDLAAFKVGARNMRAAKERTTGGSAGSSAIAERRNFNQGILSKLSPDQSTRQKRLETVLSGLPGGAKATVSDITSGSTIDVDSAGSPLVVEQAAPTGGILPPAVAQRQQQDPETQLSTVQSMLKQSSMLSGPQVSRLRNQEQGLMKDVALKSATSKLSAAIDQNMITDANGNIVTHSGQIFMTAAEKQEAEMLLQKNK